MSDGTRPRQYFDDIFTYLFADCLAWCMTVLSFDEQGVDVVYEGHDFRLEKSLIENALDKPYPDITDHEVLRMVEKDPGVSGEARRISDIID